MKKSRKSLGYVLAKLCSIPTKEYKSRHFFKKNEIVGLKSFLKRALSIFFSLRIKGCGVAI